MQSIAYIPASNGSANASLMTVQTLRSPGATTILVNTVANVPAKFYGTMGTPHTFTDPVTGETITIISEATAVDFAGHVDGSSIVIDEIAPGYEDTDGSAVGDIIVIKQNTEWANNLHNILEAAHNDDGTLQDTALDPFFKPSEIIHNFVASGGTIAQTTGLTGSFADIVYYIAGLRHSATGIANKTYTVSKDTYVDIADDGTVTYVEVANNATTGMTLTADSVRVAKVVTNGSGITSVVQSGADPLGNSIKPAGSIGAQNIDFASWTSAFSAGMGASQNLTNGQDNIVKATVERYDIGSDYDAPTYTYTAPVDGIYHFDIVVNNVGAAVVYAMVNGSQVVRPPYSGSFVAPYPFSADLLLKKGDTVQASVYAGSTGQSLTASSTQTFFDGHLVRPL